MIKTTLFYPRHEGARFDFDYYQNKHLPMVRARLGSALKHISIDKGVTGGAPNAPAPFVVLAHMRFDSLDEFQQAMAPHVEFIMNDVPNFTDIVPIPMISTSILNE
ncbi:EthD family reductase [Agrobacterium sp. MOPV5]|uniref:EthD family reductase n=1 Tax=Agrobacterium leguminum TaxID=2792015 RepID=UPI0018C27123|nr:EthD family reductase [Agrobacterium leguminum]MBG0511629.1 EthD family reductase [Agrobacterium leguminum]